MYRGDALQYNKSIQEIAAAFFGCCQKGFMGIQKRHNDYEEDTLSLLMGLMLTHKRYSQIDLIVSSCPRVMMLLTMIHVGVTLVSRTRQVLKV
jgi:hypothetical protein